MSVRTAQTARVVSALAIAVGATFPAMAGVTYTSQDRTVSTVGSGSDHDERSAPGLAPWSEVLDSYYTYIPGQPDMHCYASQTSSLNETGVLFSGLTLVEQTYPGSRPSAGSSLSANFSLSGSGAWMLTIGGTFEGGASTAPGYIQLFDVGTSALVAMWDGEHTPVSVTVPDGMYFVRMSAAVGSGSWEYDLYMDIVPAPSVGGLAIVAAGMAARRRRR